MGAYGTERWAPDLNLDPESAVAPERATSCGASRAGGGITGRLRRVRETCLPPWPAAGEVCGWTSPCWDACSSKACHPSDPNAEFWRVVREIPCDPWLVASDLRRDARCRSLPVFVRRLWAGMVQMYGIYGICGICRSKDAYAVK